VTAFDVIVTEYLPATWEPVLGRTKEVAEEWIPDALVVATRHMGRPAIVATWGDNFQHTLTFPEIPEDDGVGNWPRAEAFIQTAVQFLILKRQDAMAEAGYARMDKNAWRI